MRGDMESDGATCAALSAQGAVVHTWLTLALLVQRGVVFDGARQAQHAHEDCQACLRVDVRNVRTDRGIRDENTTIGRV
jgi:hypothetical protein